MSVNTILITRGKRAQTKLTVFNVSYFSERCQKLPNLSHSLVSLPGTHTILYLPWHPIQGSVLLSQIGKWTDPETGKPSLAISL